VTTEAASRTPAGEAGLRLLAEHLPNLILLAFDPELLIWAATGAALRARGWTPGHFVGRTVPEVGRPADAAITEAYCRAALRGECRRLDTSGKIDPSRLWSHTFVPLPDEGGVMIGGMVIARDVTDERRVERQLVASRRQLAEAQRIAQVGSWEWDLESDELTCSDELCRILGRPLGFRIAMRDLGQVLHPADLERVAVRMEQLRLDPAPFALELRIVRTDGAVRSVMVRGEGVLDTDGRLVRFIGTDQDVTDRRRAEAEPRRLLGRVYEAQEGQDRRLAADLHDGHVQSLAAIGFKLEQARLRLGASGSPEIDDLLSACNRAALVACEVTSELDGRLDPVVETALFRVAQQALANVVDHADATRALVEIECAGDGLSCGSATTAAASTPTTCRCSPTSPTSA
jgi:PAS domain S-box-containing protein